MSTKPTTATPQEWERALTTDVEAELQVVRITQVLEVEAAANAVMLALREAIRQLEDGIPVSAYMLALDCLSGHARGRRTADLEELMATHDQAHRMVMRVRALRRHVDPLHPTLDTDWAICPACSVNFDVPIQDHLHPCPGCSTMLRRPWPLTTTPARRKLAAPDKYTEDA